MDKIATKNLKQFLNNGHVLLRNIFMVCYFLILFTRMSTTGRYFPFFPKLFIIQIFIAMYEFNMKHALKWVQTSLVLVQWFLG